MEVLPPGAWHCLECGFENVDPKAVTCELCGEQRLDIPVATQNEETAPLTGADAVSLEAVHHPNQEEIDVQQPQPFVEPAPEDDFEEALHTEGDLSANLLTQTAAVALDGTVSPEEVTVNEQTLIPIDEAVASPAAAEAPSDAPFADDSRFGISTNKSWRRDESDEMPTKRRKDNSIDAVDLDEAAREAEAPSLDVPERRQPLKDANEVPAPTTAKRVGRRTSSSVASFSVASEQGRRRSMEDVYKVNGSIQDDPTKSYFAVFDGHAGPLAAEYCGQRMLDNITSTAAWRRGDMHEAMRFGIQRTEQAYLRAALSASPRWFDGTTAVALVISANIATIGWVGDSRATLGRYTNGAWTAVPLTQDHKPGAPNEHERIITSGGTVGRSLKEANARKVTAVAGARCPVFCFGAHPAAPMRCYPGGLSLSRSIGDVTLKYHTVKCVIGDPEVISHTLDLAKDRFIILGCDG